MIVDLGATCWERDSVPSHMATIEVGAVRMASSNDQADREFCSFVRQLQEPLLSDFCVSLTTITQADVNAAPPFPTVFADFQAWLPDDEFTRCSWGLYDLKQLRADYRRHRIVFPAVLERHINLKQASANVMNVKPPTTKGALRLLGLPLSGTHHRGIDDARNIARLTGWILPRLLALVG